jgi:anti-sigma regulatory factor (Ser/Thr protein kinase)
MTAATNRFPAARRESCITDNWPLYSHLELGAWPTAVSCGRLHAKHVLWEWGLSDFSDSVELVVSELLTNAIQASVNDALRNEASRKPSAMTPVHMRMASDRHRVLIEVWDGDPHPPQRVTPDPEAENGRGLLLVETLSSRWHWYFPEGRDGKVVWAELEAG